MLEIGPTSRMHLVFVNHVHPNSELVAGLRLWRFAQELTNRGHRVVFVTENITPDPTEVGSRFGRLAANHDWRAPLVLACGEAGSSPRHRSSRHGGNVPLLGKVRTASDIVFRGGVFWRWQKAAEREFEAILRTFKPEIAYATFGNLDALNVGRKLARRGRIPWVMDIKDPLTAFVPRALRELVRQRYADASAVTFNSELQREVSGAVIRRGGEVIYSGADVGDPSSLAGADAVMADGVFFSLVGSIYSDANALALLDTFVAFARMARREGQPEPQLRYFGGDHARVRSLWETLGRPRCVMVSESIPRMSLLAICRRAQANCYVGSECAFHHKLSELLAAGRPVIAFPTEWNESIAMARGAGATLQVCRTPAALMQAWSRAQETAGETARSDFGAALGWARFAEGLEQVLARSRSSSHG
jgi:hypothetical protein